MKNLNGSISGSYSKTGLDAAKVAAFESAAKALKAAGDALGVSTSVSLTVTEAEAK